MKTEALETENGIGPADGRLRRLLPRDFRTAARLAAPAAYICVLRDPNAKAYRIEATEEPKALIDALMQTGDYQFGIELVALLKSDDLAASAAYLDDKHGAVLSSDWLVFDAHQVAALNRSVLIAQQRNSFYIFPEKQTVARRGVGRRRDVKRFWSGRERERRRWRRSGELLRDLEIEEEEPLFGYFTSKHIEICFKIALLIFVLLYYLARYS